LRGGRSDGNIDRSYRREGASHAYHFILWFMPGAAPTPAV
jgi:hypothetical protein